MLTTEDLSIWERVDTRRLVVGGEANLWADCEESDRRDADLMYSAQRWRYFGEIGWLPTLAPPQDPYPYVGGIKLGRRTEWERDILSEMGDPT